uniref:Uncharacterized protein LOC111126571 isoform X2 n=1 Tax=Crassostrea virginica TaxID=6565 RepID=A0A8B8DFV4_CRAVI|nr:uncharacterized protein LOC111126571 isoform X2 [Crassostrea virginica]
MPFRKQMMILLIFAACLMFSCAKEADNAKQAVLLPCYFGSYDANSDDIVNVDEFMDATQGYTGKQQPKLIFDRFDINGDGKITPAEFREAMPGLQKDQVYDHCKKRCWWCTNCCGRR